MNKIIHILIMVFVLQSCVQEEENLFGVSASERMQKTVAEYKELLTSPQNGWIAEYYPQKNHSVGGYVMFLKFNTAGTVTANCEIATNVPANTTDSSLYDVFAEQGPILSFSTYNRVMHYFSEPSSSDVDGRAGDYEFVFMKVVSPDEIHLKGKKQGNKLVLRKNPDINPVVPNVYFDGVKKIADDVAKFGLFRLLVENKVIDSLVVSDRTMSGNSINVTFTYTDEGIRLYEPLIINGVTMLNFKWIPETGKYECTDSGVNAYFEGYFSSGFQLQYEDFIGEWEMQYNGRSTSSLSTATVQISIKQKYRSFLLSCKEIFSFPGIVLTYNPQKGTISLISQRIEFISGGSNNIRVFAYGRSSGYYSTNIGSIGLDGIWNNDANGKKQITFVDNKVWGTYKVDGILLQLYTDNIYLNNFTGNAGGHRFNNITLTKK
ncbi:MAG: DUF4302 domain-containing protein [Prevotellaceae bacterium]|jgi:hypothetical protein|nr:DUF4302 domain-containing protein [Prevotellaceae bacterium]